MFDWLINMLRNYREFCEAEERRKVKITIKSGLSVPKESAKMIVRQLQDLRVKKYTKYSDLVRMVQGQKKPESPDDKLKFLAAFLGRDIKEGEIVLTRNPVEVIYEIVCTSINKGNVVSPVEGMTLDEFLAS